MNHACERKPFGQRGQRQGNPGGRGFETTGRGVPKRREFVPGVLTEMVLDGFRLAMMTIADQCMVPSIGTVVRVTIRVGEAKPPELTECAASALAFARRAYRRRGDRSEGATRSSLRDRQDRDPGCADAGSMATWPGSLLARAEAALRREKASAGHRGRS